MLAKLREMFAGLWEKLKGWKTIVFNAALGLPSALMTIYLALSTIDFTPVIPVKYVAVFGVVWSVLGVILRFITTGPVGAKGEEAPAPDVKAGD